MQVNDLVRTKAAQWAYGYERPMCIVISIEKRIDGLVIDMMDPQGRIRRWLEEDLEKLNESR
jgi:hypothetical protein|tara:strand:- start:503 stop:688 length:186 start_codon:yes stop_codon:yes gene_type:complete